MNVGIKLTKRNTTVFVIIAILAVICLVLFVLLVDNNPISAYLLYKDYTRDDIIDNEFSQYYHYVKSNGINTYTEAYCMVSERITVKDGDTFFTVFYNPTSEKCCLSFEYSYSNCYTLDPELINETELKEFINHKAETIKAEFVKGLDNIFTDYSMTREYSPVYDCDCGDFSNREAEIVITAATGDKTVSLKINHDSAFYYDYGEGDNHYYLSTSHFTNKAHEFIGTVSDEAEFAELLHKNGIDKTFNDIFGE